RATWIWEGSRGSLRRWGKKWSKSAVFAKRRAGAAEVLAGTHDQPVVFVEEGGAEGQAVLKEGANFLVGLFAMGDMVALQNAPGISVNHEHRVLPGVEEDGIGGFGADAVNGEELLPENGGRRAKHFRKRALVGVPQETYKRFQLPRLLAEVAGGANPPGQAGGRDAFDGDRGEQFLAAQIADGAFDVAPAGVLREDGSNNDFEAGSSRPPVLRAVRPEQCIIVGLEDVRGLQHSRRDRVAQGIRAGRGKLPEDWQNAVCRHLHCKIATPWEQVKNQTLSRGVGACSGVQVLANSQRWFKIERHGVRPFAMLSGGSIASRECYGCPSVWAKYC